MILNRASINMFYPVPLTSLTLEVSECWHRNFFMFHAPTWVLLNQNEGFPSDGQLSIQLCCVSSYISGDLVSVAEQPIQNTVNMPMLLENQQSTNSLGVRIILKKSNQCHWNSLHYEF